MKSYRHHNHTQKGLAILLLMIVLVVATAIGIWGLTSSRTSMLKAGSRKFATELTYKAEQGLQKSVRRFQNIATGTADQVATANANDTSAGKTGGNYSAKQIPFLVDPASGGMCADTSCGGTPNGNCSGFNALVNFDVVNQNVVCNFLGVIDQMTQVSVVRKDDLLANDETFAIFLVNSIAHDTSGRKQVMQGVVVVPYLNSSGVYSSTAAPYLASSKALTD